MPNSFAPYRSLLPVAITAALVLTACSSTGNTTGAGAPDATRPSTADQVGALLIDNVARAGVDFALQPQRTSHTGAKDLAAAISTDGHSDARSALTSESFQHGYELLWTNPAGDTIGVQVYRFATAAGARRNYLRADRLAAEQSQSVTHYRVGAHPPGEARGAEVDVEGNHAEQVIGISGRDVMQVMCTSRTAAGLRSRALTLATAQYERIKRAT